MSPDIDAFDVVSEHVDAAQYRIYIERLYESAAMWDPLASDHLRTAAIPVVKSIKQNELQGFLRCRELVEIIVKAAIDSPDDPSLKGILGSFNAAIMPVHQYYESRRRSIEDGTSDAEKTSLAEVEDAYYRVRAAQDLVKEAGT